MTTASMTTIYCIGRNYAEHARELGNEVPAEPVVFLKSAAALRPLSGGPLAFPDETFHHEAELVLRLGRVVPLGGQGGWDDVGAVGLGLDLTRREVQNGLKAKGLPWTSAKSFAGSALLSELVPVSALPDRDAVLFTLKINGELRQSGDTRAMLFPVPALLTHLARYCELRPGDLVYTGTPPGVGPIRRGDEIELALGQTGKVFKGRL